MSHQQFFSGAIWTNHVLDRMKERGITQYQASQAFSNPDRHYNGSEAGTFRFEKRFDKSRITVVAKQNDRSEWIILSAWIDPPLPGTEDARRRQQYKKYQRSSGWGKIWMAVLRQLGVLKY